MTKWLEQEVTEGAQSEMKKEEKATEVLPQVVIPKGKRFKTTANLDQKIKEYKERFGSEEPTQEAEEKPAEVLAAKFAEVPTEQPAEVPTEVPAEGAAEVEAAAEILEEITSQGPKVVKTAEETPTQPEEVIFEEVAAKEHAKEED